MKYIKTFESIFDFKNLKKGDHVIVKTDDDRLDNELAIVTEQPFENTVKVELPEYIGDYVIYDYEIVNKLTPKQAKIFLSANKYNL